MIDLDFLANYVCRQVESFFPDGYGIRDSVYSRIEDAYERTTKCVSSLKDWADGGFRYTVSWQYSTFLYYLSNSVWEILDDTESATRLFLLNKALHSVELYYEILLPEHCFLSHTQAVVFGKASYGDFFVIHQGCTVGRNGNDRPSVDEGVVMLPGSMIIGKCTVGENSVLAPGVKMINANSPGNCYVFQGKGKRLKFKDIDERFSSRYFLL